MIEGPCWLQQLLSPDPALAELAKTIRQMLLEAPPLSLSEGDLIHDGVDPLLDGLRNQLDDQDTWLNHQEQQERLRSGISTLKLQHHRTFGYFLAVSKAKATAVPDHWIRRQTLANEERFITPDLKEREGRIFQLRARLPAGIRELPAAGAGGDHGGPNPPGGSRRCTRCPHRPSRCGRQRWLLRTNHHRRPGLQLKASRHPVVEQRRRKMLSPQMMWSSVREPTSGAHGPQRQWKELLPTPDWPYPADGSDRQLGAGLLRHGRHRRSNLHPGGCCG